MGKNALLFCRSLILSFCLGVGSLNAGTLIELKGMQQLDLVGYGDLRATYDLLKDEAYLPVEESPAPGAPPAAKFVFSTDASRQGQAVFTETYVGVFVRDRIPSIPPNPPGLFFFRNINTNRASVWVAHHVWRSPHQFGVIDFSLNLDGVSEVQVSTGTGSGQILEGGLKRGISPFPVSVSQVKYQFDALSSKAINPMGLRYSFEVSGTAYTRPYDRTVDHYRVSTESLWGKVLSKVNFQPATFQVIPSMNYKMDRPRLP